MVGTTNRSMAAMSGAWLRRKVDQPWDGGPHRLTMYFATLDCETSKPSLSSAAHPIADFRRSSAGSARAVPHRSSVGLQESGISTASTDGSRLDANVREARDGRS